MNKRGTNPRRYPALLLLISASIAGGAIARWCMSSGVGVTPDSVVYLSEADSLIAGDGLKPIAYHYAPKIASGQSVTFPPTYPLLLSLSGILSVDRVNGAKWLHTLLFALNVLLLGIAVYLSTNGSLLATLCSILLFFSSPGVLDINTMALSDAPFILFLLTASILLTLHIAKSDRRLLIGSALAAGLAITTRYAGVTIFPPMIVAVLLLKNGAVRGRIRDCLILLSIGLLPLAAWVLRNKVVANSAADRSFAFHPMKISDFKIMVNSLLTLWAPFAGHVYLKVILSLLGSALLVSAIALVLKKNRQREKSVNAGSAAQVFAAIFVPTYLLFIYAYNSLMDPPVDLSSRVFLPAYVFGIILMISAAYEFGKVSLRTIYWRGFLVLGFALVSVNAVRAVSFAVQRHANGSGFESHEWASSKSIEYIRTLPPDRTIYSNGIDVIHFLTGRKALRVPARFDPTGNRSNAEFEQEIYAMRNELMQHRAVMIYLNHAGRWYLPSRDELETTYQLPVLIRLEDGVVFGTP